MITNKPKIKIASLLLLCLTALLLLSCENKYPLFKAWDDLKDGAVTYTLKTNYHNQKMSYIIRVAPTSVVQEEINKNPVYGWKVSISLQDKNSKELIDLSPDASFGAFAKVDINGLDRRDKELLIPDYKGEGGIANTLRELIDSLITPMKEKVGSKSDGSNFIDIYEIRGSVECSQEIYNSLSKWKIKK
jgi:hypothetical protein